MKGTLGNVVGRTDAVLLLFLLTALVPAVMALDGIGDTRLGSMVHFDIFSTRISSDGVSGWENFVVGAVNRTTTIETRLINDIDVPLSSVEVTCTSYWYEGNYPDRGHIMFRETVLVDLPGGKYSASDAIRFRWTPTVSGSYIINVSAHVPGDARVMSTDPIFFQGRKYQEEGKGYFYSGVWVAKRYWDCSSFDGWGSASTAGGLGEGWRPVIHPLGESHDLQHSAPWTFWAGNITSGLAPVEGTHSLTTPELDLEGFSPDPYDIEVTARRPQIYLVYRYRGNLTATLGGRGQLFHYVSTDGGSTWSPLMDTKRNHVNISGTHPDIYWSYSSRPAAYGTGRLVGIDLGAYIGKRIMVRMDLVPSGLEQTGVLVDDIVLMGVDRLDERPFSLTGPLEPALEVEPSGMATFSFNVSTKRWETDLLIRFGAVNATGEISTDRDVVVDPEVVLVPAGTEVVRTVKVNVTIPKGAMSGQGRVTVRAAGGGHSQDVELRFLVKAVHKLISTFEGSNVDEIEPGKPVAATVRTENTGNIQERVEVTFVTGTDLEWDHPRKAFVLYPRKAFELHGNISVPLGSRAGPKAGHFVVSPSSLPSDQEVLDRLEDENPDSDWTVFPVHYSSKQFHDIRLISTGTRQDIDEPPSVGSRNLTYNLFLMNVGNGNDLVTFSCSDIGSREGIWISLPDDVNMSANDTKVLDVNVRVDFPLPDGIYNFTVRACSSGTEDPLDNAVDLFLIVGRPPVSRGIFLLNGSLQVRPEKVVMGQETIFFFKVRSFGYLQPVQFTVNFLIDGVQVEAGVFTSSLQGVKEYQFSMELQTPGTKGVTLALSGPFTGPEPGGDLTRSLNITIEVHFIEIAITGLGLNGREGARLNGTFPPGENVVRATVMNLGDMDVELVTLHLTVQEVSGPENRTTIVLNVSDLVAGSQVRLEHKFRSFKPSTTYQVTLSFQDRGLWKEANNTNDLQTMVIRIGEEEPKEPVWRMPLFQYVTGGIVLLALLGMSYYLIRKNL